jgi:hypothetical protein
MLIQNNAALLLIYLSSIGIIFASMDYHMTTNSIELLLFDYKYLSTHIKLSSSSDACKLHLGTT